MPALATFVSLLAIVMAFMPTSPFKAFINALPTLPYLDVLNWFVPVSEIVAILEVWVACVVVYYTYSVIMRWIKVIK